jgi:bile acid-coenzyme A ligase
MTASASYGAQLRYWGAQRPSSPAVTVIDPQDREETLTYGELDRLARTLARRLAALGVGPDDVVPICLPNSPALFVGLFGAWMLGACPAPLRHDLPEAERDRLIALLKPKALIGDWAIEGESVPAAQLLGPTPDAQPADELADVVPRRMWAIGSGGSTGTPKMIVSLRPASVQGRFAVMLDHDAAAGQACQVVCGPLYHTSALALGMGSLLTGDRIVVLQRFDADQALRAVQRYRASMMGLVATMLVRALRAYDQGAYDLSSLKLLIAGAGAIPNALARRWCEILGPERFLVGYGSSEGVGATRLSGAELLERPGSVGRAFACDLRIQDEAGEALAPGQIGEVYARPHEGLTFEYLGAPAPRATADGFLSVGDLGWLDEDGYLFIADRRTDMIKTGGVNVFPAEVEACLIQHPDVADIAVIGLPDAEWGRRVHAVVVPADRLRPPPAEALTAFCKARLSPVKAPKTYEFVDGLPRNDAMKLNRGKLAEERIMAQKD